MKYESTGLKKDHLKNKWLLTSKKSVFIAIPYHSKTKAKNITHSVCLHTILLKEKSKLKKKQALIAN